MIEHRSVTILCEFRCRHNYDGVCVRTPEPFYVEIEEWKQEYSYNCTGCDAPICDEACDFFVPEAERDQDGFNPSPPDNIFTAGMLRPGDAIVRIMSLGRAEPGYYCCRARVWPA